MITVNFWAILVAAIVSFAIGALWYSPILFGKEWMTLSKMTAADIAAAKAKGMWKGYVIQFVVSLISFLVLGFLVSATSGMTASDGAFLGFLAWLGFSATEAAGRVLWERKPMKLVLINSVCVLLSLVIGGAIIGAWYS